MKCAYCKKEHQNNNTGCNNSGDYNSGGRNSGNYNSGNYNSGGRNSGGHNSGGCNSGNYNSGNYNSGGRNSGNCNSGYCNSGNYNSGWFNTDEPKMRFFNKDSNKTYSEFTKGKVVYPDLKITTWVDIKELPEAEKNEDAIQRGGMLKTLSYKEAWAEYWGRASEEDKKWFMNLPNFDPQIFEEITGIQVIAESLSGKTVKVEIDGKSYEAVIK